VLRVGGGGGGGGGGGCGGVAWVWGGGVGGGGGAGVDAATLWPSYAPARRKTGESEFRLGLTGVGLQASQHLE